MNEFLLQNHHWIAGVDIHADEFCIRVKGLTLAIDVKFLDKLESLLLFVGVEFRLTALGFQGFVLFFKSFVFILKFCGVGYQGL